MTNKRRQLLIIGSSGHARSIADSVTSSGIYELVGFVSPEEMGEEVYAKKGIIGHDDDLPFLYQSGITSAAIGIGFMGDNSLRLKLISLLKEIGFSLPIIIDPTATIANDVILEEGAFVGKGAIVNTGANIGPHSIINTAAIVDHDCIIGKSCHISIGTVLSGNVQIGNEVFVGANSTVIQNITVASRCTIGAGSVITRSIKQEGSLVVGFNRIIRGDA